MWFVLLPTAKFPSVGVVPLELYFFFLTHFLQQYMRVMVSP